MITKRTALAALAVLAASVPARAAVTISTAATQNMNCSGGTCIPTATKAVLNVSDLESDLSQFGNVHVMTTGSGVEANNIVVQAAFASPDTTSLTLEAHDTITINRAVSIGSGAAELELQSHTLGAIDALSFGRKEHITFGSLSDIFGINGGIYTLVGSVQGLASAIAANPSGAFALANSYDASQDGTYTQAPVQTITGTFNGLGNAISNLSIKTIDDDGALFWFIDDGTVDNIGLIRVAISTWSRSAALALENNSTISHAYSTGRVEVRGGDAIIGGLVAENIGTITDSYSTVGAKGGRTFSGGLVGDNYGLIGGSFATGSVTQDDYYAGGLVGRNTGSIVNSYATGAVSSGRGGLDFGGLVGFNSTGTIGASYSMGTVTGSESDGGFVGFNYPAVTDGYWDTTTSGTETGVGSGRNSGVTGLTTEQFQSGLPTGFDPAIWAEDSNINGGLPYLINNPPPK